MSSFLQQWGGDPSRLAVVMAETGASLTYGELEQNSARLARLWYEAGLRPGDHVALMMGNHLRFMEVYWAAMRSGLYFTTVNAYLTSHEVQHIVRDSGARALVVDATIGDKAGEIAAQPDAPTVRHSVGGTVDGYASYEEALLAQSDEPLPTEVMGARLLYSSGSTGLPKAIERSLPGVDVSTGARYHGDWLAGVYAMTAESVAVSPAPLYHAAPLSFASGCHAIGATLVLMAKFDAEGLLAAIDEHRASHALMVPTMFVRLLRLPEDVRTAFDPSSLRYVVHGASPCPVPVKADMIAWWGPVLWEYYAGTEDNGSTVISSEEWLEHRGSVGRAAPGSEIHICDASGEEQTVGQDGIVYFEQVGAGALEPFVYHGAKEKTDASRHPVHPRWTTLGDVGRLDADGYLYLTDRIDYMIISGGVNISPQEIEDTLLTSPDVLDVAVFGVPNEEFGEEVKAVVQLAEGLTADAAVAEQLREFARTRLARHKVPRTIDFIDEMPRSPAGKLYKKRLRERYVEAGSRR